MSEMDGRGDRSVQGLIANIEKRSEACAAPTETPQIVGDIPTGAVPADVHTFSMGAKFSLGSRPSPPAERLEALARSAMLAAARAIIQPWLFKNFPGIVEQRLSTLLKERVDEVVIALNQQVSQNVIQRLESTVREQTAAVERDLAGSVLKAIADSLDERIEQVSSVHVAAAEARIVGVLKECVTASIDERLAPAMAKRAAAIDVKIARDLRERLAVIEDRIPSAVDERVAASVSERLEPAVTAQVSAVELRTAAALTDRIAEIEERIVDAMNKRIAGVEAQIAAALTEAGATVKERLRSDVQKQIKDEISRRLARLLEIE